MYKKIKINRNGIMNLNSVLDSLKDKCSPIMKYAIKINKSILKEEVEAIREAYKSNIERYNEFEPKRFELYDEKGKLKEGKSNDLKVLEEEYKGAIEDRKEETDEFMKLLLEEIEVEIYQVSNDLIPNLSQEDYDKIFPMISEE